MLLILQVIAWLLWAGSVVAIIKIDQRRRAVAAKARRDEVDASIFEDKSVTRYLVIAFVCGALVLPIYFYSTRKTAKGALIGVGWTIASTLGIVLILSVLTGPLQRMATRGGVTSDASACMSDEGISGSWRCETAGTAYLSGANAEKNVAKAADLFARGCDRGDVEGCFNLLSMPPGQVPAAKIESVRAQGTKLCAASPDPVRCPMFTMPAHRK